jgi:hypothetical protein
MEELSFCRTAHFAVMQHLRVNCLSHPTGQLQLDLDEMDLVDMTRFASETLVRFRASRW